MYLLRSQQQYSNAYTYKELPGLTLEGALMIRDSKRREAEETYRVTRDGQDRWNYEVYSAHQEA